MVNVSRGLDNLKIKLDDLDVDMLKTVSLDLKSLSDIISKKYVENKKNIKPNAKVRNPDASALIQTNQYDTDKQKLEKKNVHKKIPEVGGLVTHTSKRNWRKWVQNISLYWFSQKNGL